MNREHFFTELKIQLKKIPLPANEKLTIIERYEEKYDQKITEGLSEEEASKELGSPKKIVEKIIDDLQLDYQETTENLNGWQEFTNTNDPNTYQYDDYYAEKKPSPLTKIMQIIGLLCLNAFLMFWIFFMFYTLAFAGWLMAISFTASPLLVAVSAIFQGINPLNFFMSLAFCGLGIIGLFIMIPLSYFLWKLTKQYVHWNLNILRGVY